MNKAVNNKQEISVKWEKLNEYIWTEIEKEWPHFWSDDIDDLAFYVIENCNINTGPEELSKSKLIDVINKYLNEHSLISLSPLENKYKELGKEIEAFKDIAYDIYIDWYIGRGRASFEIQEDGHFKEDFKNYLDKMHKQYGFSVQQLELVAYFAGPDVSEEILEQGRGLMINEFEKFQDKWNPILKEEIRIVNDLLKDIVEKRIFNDEGKLIDLNTKEEEKTIKANQ